MTAQQKLGTLFEIAGTPNGPRKNKCNTIQHSYNKKRWCPPFKARKLSTDILLREFLATAFIYWRHYVLLCALLCTSKSRCIDQHILQLPVLDRDLSKILRVWSYQPSIIIRAVNTRSVCARVAHLLASLYRYFENQAFISPLSSSGRATIVFYNRHWIMHTLVQNYMYVVGWFLPAVTRRSWVIWVHRRAMGRRLILMVDLLRFL